MNEMKQRNTRTTFTVEGVRGEAIFAFRQSARIRNVEEGEVISQILEEAVLNKLNRNAGRAMLDAAKAEYFLNLDKDN